MTDPHGGDVGPAVPDVFADSFALNTTEYGCTITLSRANPTQQDANAERQVVCRIRMTPKLLFELGQVIAKNVVGSALSPVRDTGVVQ